ncbi:succinylglutamate desuccinylase [Paraburkholderia sp. NMBU_R16]|uniref:succinylglutamate desuccinylase n=1 Tax=Paraburkholderia sp. NMBU_R16 TaxID=2698676 RepID=UPI001565B772|nr:succinylglutamate desuccinylase [Paraburkholderia sp. NMBU_R16]NRO97989.1 succinylglutamate desuccinylase [Paraburkholderia sp. NMBU_R16]
MTSNADGTRTMTDAPGLLTDFLSFSLADARPVADRAGGECAHGVRYQWLGAGLLQFEPEAKPVASVVVSAGVHGDETAPIELVSRMVADIACGALPLACRLLVVLGNIGAMRAACRYLDDDLNRLFCGAHARLHGGSEKARAATLEAATARFFAQAAPADAAPRWHIDMHTAIRASVFEQFALLPHTGRAPADAMLEWLARARIAAILLHTAAGTTYTQFTAQTYEAMACTLELGKVRPFGQNDLSHFDAADRAVRSLVANVASGSATPMPRVFTVVDQITKRTDAFELALASDVPNFTVLAKGQEVARDGDYRYIVTRGDERIVFPNPSVKPGLRAGLIVVETTAETLARTPRGS